MPVKYTQKPIVWSLSLLIIMLLTGCLPEGAEVPESPLLSSLERKSGLIVYLGTDGNLHVINQGGGGEVTVTDDAELPGAESSRFVLYDNPAWSPDSQQLAYIRLAGDIEGELENAAIYVSNVDGSEQTEIFSSEVERPVYIDWSPDAQTITFISSNPIRDVMLFQQVAADGSSEAEVLDAGTPFYWDWSPAGDSLLIHASGAAILEGLAKVSVLDPAQVGFEDKLDFAPGFFQSPQWSPDGSQMLVSVEHAEQEFSLVLTNRWGEIEQTLLELEGDVAFGWSPDGSQVAAIQGLGVTEEGIVGQLLVLDPANPDDVLKSESEQVMAFFWAPDGQSVAYFEVARFVPEDQPQSGAQSENAVIVLTLYTLDAQDGSSRELATFIPTDSFLSTLLFFDQYTRSYTLWSPDSENIVVSGLAEGDVPSIWVVPASGTLAERILVPGYMGFWSWE